MPEWLKDLLLAVVGSAPILGGVGWWFKSRREDRKELEHKVETLQAKIESLLADAIAREKEATRAALEDAETTRQRLEVWRTTNDVLAQLTRALARKDGGA